MDEEVEPWQKRMRSGLEPSVAESRLPRIWKTSKDPYREVAKQVARLRAEHAVVEVEAPHRIWSRLRHRH